MTIGAVAIASGPIAGPTGAAVTTDTQTTLAVEVSFTTGALEEPVWVDITPDVRSWNTQRGRRRELERFQPGRATVVLGNLSRQYDSVYADGPWFGHIKPMKRIRIRETFNGVTYPVFDGYVDKWVLDYPGTGKDATATVIATDGFKVFQRTDLPKSVFAKAVADSGAQTYWRLDETIQGLQDGEAVNEGTAGAAHDATFFNEPGVGAQGLVVNDPGKAMFVNNSNLYEGAVVQGVDSTNSAIDLLANTTFSVEAWCRLDHDGLSIGTPYFILWRVSEAGTSNIHATCAYTNNGAGTDSHFEFSVVTGGGAAIYGARSVAGSAVVGKIHHVVCVIDADEQMAIYVDGTRYTTSTGFTGSDLTGITRPTGGRITVGRNGTTSAGAVENWAGTIDDVAVYESIVLTQADVTTHLQAGTAPWQNDLSGARLVRIADIVGWPSALREIDTGLTTLQSASLNTPALEHLQGVAETEFGLLFMSRDGKLRFLDRTAVFAREPGTAIYGDAADGVEVGYRNFVPDDGDEAIRNRALISRLGGGVRISTDTSSVTEFGRFDYQLDGLYHRLESYSQDYANLITSQYAEQRRRITSIDIGPPITGEEDTVYPAMLGPELGNAVVVRNRPTDLGDAFEQTCVVEGIEHSGSPGGVRTTRLILSPEMPIRALEDEDVALLGLATVTANQEGITTVTDLTGLTVTVTVGANRYIRISFEGEFDRSVVDGTSQVILMEGGTALQTFGYQPNIANENMTVGGSLVIDSPSAGSHTYKLTLTNSTGTGNSDLFASSTIPAQLWVEDIGPS